LTLLSAFGKTLRNLSLQDQCCYQDDRNRTKELIEQGKPTDWLYFVLNGALEVYTRGTPRIAMLKVGDVVGEISFVDARPPTATLRAEVESRVGAIPRGLIMERIRENIGFAARFYQSIAIFLADRLRTCSDYVKKSDNYCENEIHHFNKRGWR
jgi:CRP-like cAMP-binding protein